MADELPPLVIHGPLHRNCVDEIIDQVLLVAQGGACRDSLVDLGAYEVIEAVEDVCSLRVFTKR